MPTRTPNVQHRNCEILLCSYVLEIMQVFYLFNLAFRGVPEQAIGNKEESYNTIITKLKEKVLDTGDAVGSTHWRLVKPLFSFSVFPD